MQHGSELLDDVGLLLEVDRVLLHFVLGGLARGELGAELGGCHVQVQGVVLPLQGAVCTAAAAVTLQQQQRIKKRSGGRFLKRFLIFY